MNSEQEEGQGLRSAIRAGQAGLARIAWVMGCIAILWLWLGIAGLMDRGFSNWIIFPVGILGAVAFGLIAFWALKRRANDEPALIVDEVGIFDNVSMVRAGRVKWNEMEKVWIAGPSWLPVLCILPDNVSDYMGRQPEVRGAIMRVSFAMRHAPIVVPLVALDAPVDDIWHHIEKVAGSPRLQRSPRSKFATGA